MTIKQFTLAEVALHDQRGDCWIVIHGKVYDVSHFESHPGGLEILIDGGGQDRSEGFDKAPHYESAKTAMTRYYLGDIATKKAGCCLLM